MNYLNNNSRNCCNGCGSSSGTGTYVTIHGPQRPMSPRGIKGDTGYPGPIEPRGDKCDTGKTPAITMVEDTPLSYRLNFKTSTDDITNPNLYKTLEEYHVNLSAASRTLQPSSGHYA